MGTNQQHHYRMYTHTHSRTHGDRNIIFIFMHKVLSMMDRWVLFCSFSNTSGGFAARIVWDLFCLVVERLFYGGFMVTALNRLTFVICHAELLLHSRSLGRVMRWSWIPYFKIVIATVEGVFFLFDVFFWIWLSTRKQWKHLKETTLYAFVF